LRVSIQDPITVKWTRARYRASIADIRHRYAEWEPIGPPEYRKGGAPMFSPFARISSSQPDDAEPVLDPRLDELEAFIACCFPRRCVSYCARRQRFAATQGAAALLLTVRSRRKVTARGH
jgi:hypothetical protein